MLEICLNGQFQVEFSPLMQLRPDIAEASFKSQDKTVTLQYLDSELSADKVAFLFFVSFNGLTHIFG